MGSGVAEEYAGFFHFYRPQASWSLISVNFGDQLGVLENLK